MSSSNDALSLDATLSQLAPVDSVKHRSWQKDNSPRPQILERAGYLPSSTHCQDTDQFGYVNAPDKRRSSLSIESAASRKVSGSRSEGPGLEAGPCGLMCSPIGKKMGPLLGNCLKQLRAGFTGDWHGHIIATQHL